MQVDIKDGRPAGRLGHEVGVPNLLEKRSRGCHKKSFNSTVNVSFSQRFGYEQGEERAFIPPKNTDTTRKTLDTLLPCPPRSSHSQVRPLSGNWSHYGSRIQPAQRHVEGRKALASRACPLRCCSGLPACCPAFLRLRAITSAWRSEEHTSELQSQ